MSRRKLVLAVEEVLSATFLALVWKYLAESMCQEVFAATRKRERQRKWTLYALVWFWIALLQSRYAGQASVDATPEAFSRRCRTFGRYSFEMFSAPTPAN